MSIRKLTPVPAERKHIRPPLPDETTWLGTAERVRSDHIGPTYLVHASKCGRFVWYRCECALTHWHHMTPDLLTGKISSRASHCWLLPRNRWDATWLMLHPNDVPSKYNLDDLS